MAQTLRKRLNSICRFVSCQNPPPLWLRLSPRIHFVLCISAWSCYCMVHRRAQTSCLTQVEVGPQLSQEGVLSQLPASTHHPVHPPPLTPRTRYHPSMLVEGISSVPGRPRTAYLPLFRKGALCWRLCTIFRKQGTWEIHQCHSHAGTQGGFRRGHKIQESRQRE